MGLTQRVVHEIVTQAVSKNVDIPEFQREFVWDPEQVKLLAESLYRGYPVGSFLLWDSKDYQEAKTAQGTQASLWIVDGQQRTTALCLLLGMKPYWWPEARDWDEALGRYDVMVNIAPDDGQDRLEFALPNPIRKREPKWISVRQVVSQKDVGTLTPMAQGIVNRLTADAEEQIALFGKVHARLQRLWQIRNREIPVIETDHEVEDVAEIFARLNQEGTRVREADVILALAAVRNPGWVREEYLPFRTDLEERGWDLDAGVFIRTMTGIGYGRARLIEVSSSFWDSANLPSVWKPCRETIADAIRRLAEFGILTSELLPSTNSLIPLFTLHYRWGGKVGYAFRRALYWFLQANRDGRYSGSAITTLNEDVRAVNEASTANEALGILTKRLRVDKAIGADEFLERYDRKGSRFLRMMLYLTIFHRDATDWADGTRLGYDKTGSSVVMGFEPHWHHIFTRRMLRDAKVPSEETHALSNITVMNSGTNVKKLSGKEPWRYIQEFEISPDSLERHLIPGAFVKTVREGRALKQHWNIERYSDFLIDRAQGLSNAVNALLTELQG